MNYFSKFLSFASLCASICSGIGFGICHFPASAQDLNRESLPEAFIKWTRLKGNGAVLETCDLVKGYILRCQSDRPLRRVECLPNFVLDPKLESLDSETKKTELLYPYKLGTRAFACAVSRKEMPLLNSTIKVFLLSDDGNLSDYLIRFGSQKEVEKTYANEFAFVTFQKEAFLSRPVLTPFFSSLNASQSYTRWGMDAAFSLSPKVETQISWSKALTGSDQWAQEFSVKLLQRISTKPFAQLGLSVNFSKRLGENIQSLGLVLKAEQNLGLSFLHLTSHLGLQYPQVLKLRQSYDVGGGLKIGPFFSQRLSMQAGASYVNQLWTQKSGQIWQENGLQILASMSLVFDAKRNAP